MAERYFFDIGNGERHLDADGDPLEGPQAARLEAARVLADLLRMRERDFLTSGRIEITVADAARTPLFQVRAVIEEVTPR